MLSDTTTISSDDIEDVFTDTKGSGILLLLDGIERLPNIKSDEMTEFFDVIRLYLWPKCAVILTTAFPCYLHQEDGPIQNVRSLVCEASVDWKKYLVAGLTQHDVKQHAHLYFAEHLLSSCSIIQFKKLAQMFQKDIYDAIKTSPMAIYMLCRVFFLHYSGELFKRFYQKVFLQGIIVGIITKQSDSSKAVVFNLGVVCLFSRGRESFWWKNS